MAIRSIVVAAASTIIAAAVLVAPAAGAHQRVDLGASDATPASGPLLVDGTVSFAVRARVERGDRRGFRFQLQPGDEMRMQLLIEDKAPDNSLPATQLPRVSVIDPQGRRTRMVINERTEFYEPYGGTTYWYLSRIDQDAVPGTYRVFVSGRAKTPVDAVIAVGYREVRGEVRE